MSKSIHPLEPEDLMAYLDGELAPDRAAAAKAVMAECKTDLARLDAAVARWSAKLLNTMPDCLNKTIESLRKKKLEHWQRNCETNRSWLALNMMTEAKAGFRAFNEGTGGRREVDFAELRRRLARGEPWSAYKAMRLGLLNEVVPVLTRDGAFIPNPLVVTDRFVDDMGQLVYGEPVPPDRAAAAKALMAGCKTDFARLDAAVARWSAKLLNTMPDCLNKTIESLRKKKLEHWQRNCETNRSWLALNMMTEAKAGFRAFNEGVGGRREVDFAELRRRLARGEPWDDDLFEAIRPSGAARV